MPSTLNDRKLSPNFTLHELVASQTAARKNIEEQFAPPDKIVENLIFLSNNLLEKLRNLNDDNPLFISSGYRCPRLNKVVGGAKTSQHLNGQAADIDFNSRQANKEFFDKVRTSEIIFDQLLNEFDFKWIHISLKSHGNRREVLAIT